MSLPVLGLRVYRGWPLLQQAVRATDLVSVSYCHFCWLPGEKRTMYTDTHTSQEKVNRMACPGCLVPIIKDNNTWLRSWQVWRVVTHMLACFCFPTLQSLCCRFFTVHMWLLYFQTWNLISPLHKFSVVLLFRHDRAVTHDTQCSCDFWHLVHRVRAVTAGGK